MVSTSLHVIIRRIVFWMITLVMVVCSLMSAHSFLFTQMTQLAVIILALWCGVFVRQEPLLVRVALALIVIVSAGSLWIYRL
jgi:succinate-acetate transporter protein